MAHISGDRKPDQLITFRDKTFRIIKVFGLAPVESSEDLSRVPVISHIFCVVTAVTIDRSCKQWINQQNSSKSYL